MACAPTEACVQLSCLWRVTRVCWMCWRLHVRPASRWWLNSKCWFLTVLKCESITQVNLLVLKFLLKVWKFETDQAVFSSPCLWSSRDTSQTASTLNCVVFGSHDCHVYAVDTRRNLLWKFKMDAPVYSSPFIFNISRNTDPTSTQYEYCVVACSTKGLLSVLSLNNGQCLCSLKLPGDVFSSPVVFRSSVFVGCRDNFLYCIQPDFK